ncbi:MAG: hypothetical protein ACP5DX_03965 [Paracoccaceae bacterium]
MNALHQRVIDMAKGGTPPREIAPQVGRKIDTVYWILACARKNGEPIPKFKGTGAKHRGIKILVPQDVVEMLEPDAFVRELTVRALCRKLLEGVAEGDLVGAVLDDNLGGANV